MAPQEEQKPPLKKHFTPGDYLNRSCIHLPASTGHYTINPQIIQILPLFYGNSNEEPCEHLNNFLEVCTTTNIQHLSEEGLKLRLFPFSLKDKAKKWLNCLPANSITTWDQLCKAFLTRYYPIGKTMEMRHVITNFTGESCIHMPASTGHYTINPQTIQILPSFYGKSNEEPYEHLNNFLEVCTTTNIQHLSEEGLKLRLFPFSLKDKAKQWLNSLPANSITTWDQLCKAFLTKYYPIGKTMKIRRAITNFTQLDGEPFHESWERFNELIRRCPHHEILPWQLVKSFYDGIFDQYHQMIDAACGGTFFNKNEDEAWSLFESLSENSQHHASSSCMTFATSCSAPKHGGIYEIGHAVDVQGSVAILSRKLDQLLARGQTNTPTPPFQQACALCTSPAHFVSDCPLAPQYPEFVQEQVNALQGFSKPGNDPGSV